MNYQGHHKDGSSIQNHSAGSHYPYIVQIRQGMDMDTMTAEVIHPDGHVETIRTSYPSQQDRLNVYQEAFDRATELAVEFARIKAERWGRLSAAR